MNPTSSILEGGLTNSNIASIQGTNYTTDALTVGQLVPNTSTVTQADGVAVYSQNNDASTTAVGLYSQVLAGINGAQNRGAYTVCNDFSFAAMSYTGVSCYGQEIDVNVQNSGTTGTGLYFNGALGGNAGNIGAIHIPKPTTGAWAYGLKIEDLSLLDSSRYAFYSGSSAATSGTSYPAAFVGTDGAGIHHGIILYADTRGALTQSTGS